MSYIVKESTLLMDYLLKVSGKKRNDIKNALKFGYVYVNGEVQKHYAYELKVGDKVEMSKEKKPSLPFQIIYEDQEMLVIDKPCGMVSEQTSTNKFDTAFAYAKEYLKTKKETAFLVHRLDQFTSGVLMIVKNQKLADFLTHHWNEQVTKRGYIAIVDGQMDKQKDTIQNYLAENKTQKVYITSKQEGKLAITHYKVVKTNKRYSMLEVHLDTGRKNQIRVHLSSLHHPIVGDKKYGSISNPLQRLGLHANEFAFIHPFTKKEYRFISRTPEEFENLFKKY